jgi:hypothetical protein
VNTKSRTHCVEAVTKIGSVRVQQVRTPRGVAYLVGSRPKPEITSKAEDLVKRLRGGVAAWRTMTVKAAKALLA